MSDIVKRLHYACHDPETRAWLDPCEFTHATLEDVMEAIQKIQKLQAALSFYAEEDSWRHTISLGHSQIDGTTSAALKDSGEIARAALGEKE